MLQVGSIPADVDLVERPASVLTDRHGETRNRFGSSSVAKESEEPVETLSIPPPPSTIVVLNNDGAPINHD